MDFKNQAELVDYIWDTIKHEEDTEIVKAFKRAVKPAMRREKLKRALSYVMGKRHAKQ